jgi:hypothetical protein
MEAAGNRGRVLTPGCDGMKAMRTASMLMMGRSREQVAQPRRNAKRPAARGSGRKKARLELMPSANCGKSASMNRVIPFFIRKAWRVCIGLGSRHRSARSTPLLSAKGQGPRADNRSCDVVHRDRQRLRRRVPGTPARSRSLEDKPPAPAACPCRAILTGTLAGLAPATSVCVLVAALGDKGANRLARIGLPALRCVLGVLPFYVALQIPMPVLKVLGSACCDYHRTHRSLAWLRCCSGTT